MSIAIDGRGILCGLGRGLEEVASALWDGKDGLREIDRFDTSHYYQSSGALVPELPGDTWFSERFLSWERSSHLTLGMKILLLSLVEAGAGKEDADPDRIAIVMGNTNGGMAEATRYYDALVEGASPDRVSVRHTPRFLAGKEVDEVARIFGWIGPAMAVSSACASGLQSIAIAAEMLLSGEVDVAYAGGYEPYCEFTHAGFCSLQAITKSTTRPFSASRDGLILGEGAGVLRLVRAEDAGTESQRHVSGWGHTADRFHPTQPDPEGAGASKAMQTALECADLSREDVGGVVAHATATAANDSAEATALRHVYGATLDELPVTCLKPRVGHCLGAAGGVEAVLATLMLDHWEIVPVTHGDVLDAACGEHFGLVRNGPRSLSKSAMMINSFGFGGMNASVILT